MLVCRTSCTPPTTQFQSLRQTIALPCPSPRRYDVRSRRHGSFTCSPVAGQTASAESTWGHPDAVRRRQEATLRRAKRKSDVEALRMANNSWWQVSPGKNVATVNTREEYAIALARRKEEFPLVVVDFFAPWCCGCRALYPKLCQIASANLDVAFIKVNTEVEEMRELAADLGVVGLPFFNLHSSCRNNVQAFTANLTKVNRLRTQIDAMKQECQIAVDGLMEV